MALKSLLLLTINVNDFFKILVVLFFIHISPILLFTYVGRLLPVAHQTYPVIPETSSS